MRCLTQHQAPGGAPVSGKWNPGIKIFLPAACEAASEHFLFCYWNWTANSEKGQACHFSALVSAFSLEARKCTLLTQCRLNIKFSECSPIPHHCFLLSPSEIPERHCCRSGSDLFYFHMASSIFPRVLILLAGHLGLKPHSHSAVFLNFFASLSCAFLDLMTALGQTGATRDGNSASGLPEDILKWPRVCEMVMGEYIVVFRFLW